jgi:methionyl-tRNA formyltransferase
MICLLMGEGPSSWAVANALAARHALTVIVEQPESRPRFLHRRLKRLGPVKVADQILFKAFGLLANRERALAAMRRCGLDPTPRDCVRVSSANAKETKALLRDARPDVVVVNGTRILSQSVLRSTPAPFINIHAGITPSYRGVHGAYWAFVNGEPARAGVTVHLMDPGIDTGPVLYQAPIQPSAEDDFFTYPVLQLAAGLPLLLKAIDDALAGRLRPMDPEGPSALWTHPGLSEYLFNRFRLGVR